jgi:hypothetical protein
MSSAWERKPFFVGGAESLSRDLKADGTVPLTANWNVGAFTLTMGGLTVNSVATSEATVSATNLITNGDFATNDLTSWTAAAGWSAATGKAVHTAGIADVTALVQAVAMTTGAIYQIQFTISGRTAGTLTMTCGALPTNMNAISADGIQYWSVTAAATTNYNLTFTPTATFDGAIDNISVKLVTANATPLVTIANSAGTAIAPIRGNPTLKNIGIGPNALRYNTTGDMNVILGNGAGQNITTGFYNTAIGTDTLQDTTASHRNVALGYAALQKLTSGNANSAFGAYAMQNATTGGNNTAMGYCSLFSTVGTYNAALGHYAGFGNTSGIYNTFVGVFAGQYIANGATANTTGDYGVFIGADTRALADNDQNEIVIGDLAIGAGSNSATLGSTLVTKTVLRGEVTSYLISNADSDTDEVDSFTWAGGAGLIIAYAVTDGKSAIWRLAGTTLTAVSVDVAFTATKDNAATYNVYFEGGALKLQNKVGDNKVMRLGFFGI